MRKAWKHDSRCTVCFCYENLQDYFDFWPLRLIQTAFYFNSHLSEHSICPTFPYYYPSTMLSHFSKLLPNGKNGQLYHRAWHPHPHARVTRVNWDLTLSHSKTPSCAWCCGLVQTTIFFLRAGFQTFYFCFPWHSATVAVLVSFCVFTTALLRSAPIRISFS